MAAKRKKKHHHCMECGERFNHGIGLRKHQRMTGHKRSFATGAPFQLLALPVQAPISAYTLLRIVLVGSALSLALLITRLAKHFMFLDASANRSLWQSEPFSYGPFEFLGVAVLLAGVLGMLALGCLWWHGSWPQASDKLERWRVELLSGAMGVFLLASHLNWIHLEASWFLLGFALTLTSELWVPLIPKRPFPPDPKRDGFVMAESVKLPTRNDGRRLGMMPASKTVPALDEISRLLAVVRRDSPNLYKLALAQRSPQQLRPLIEHLQSKGHEITNLAPILDAVVFCDGDCEELIAQCVERIKIYETA